MMACLPSAPFLWSKLGEYLTKRNIAFGSKSLPANFTIMRAIEIVMEDFITDCSILQVRN